MEKIIYSTRVKHYLEKLVYTLLKKEYFSYPATAHEYVQSIRDSIEHNIATTRHRKTPPGMAKYGRYYASFPHKNKRTTWYAFFDKANNRYFIGHIINNHIGKARELNGLK